MQKALRFGEAAAEVLNSFLQSFKLIEGITSQTETQAQNAGSHRGEELLSRSVSLAWWTRGQAARLYSSDHAFAD